MVRRIVAAGVGLVVVLVLVFGIRGCLDSRREQALKDYNRDVSGVVADADANAERFFATLSGGGSTQTDDVQSEVNQLRFRAQALTKRAEAIEVPDEMRPAQRNLILALSLVQEAMAKTAEKLPAALSSDAATAIPAVEAIAGEMQAFDAANVVYNRRTAALIKQILDDNEIGGQVIETSSFLQNLGWLAPSTVAKRIDSQAARGAGDGAATDVTGLHGHGLLAVSVGTQTLVPGKGNRILAASSVTFTAKIANQGDSAETDVRVRVRIRGAGDPITEQSVVDQTAAKSETTVSVRVDQPPIGEAVTITVQVLPVPGEKNTTNNTFTFPALFDRA